MCGLVGVAGSIGKLEVSAFWAMLQLDTVRGPHSTGIARVGVDGKCRVRKALGTPWDYIKEYDKESIDIKAWLGNSKVLMGHNRWATKGAITAENAHPFILGHLVGAHNGTLDNQSLLDNSKDFVVDSENIYHHMAINSVEDTVKKLHGAFALSWYNSDDNSLNFIRNTRRPLFYVYSRDKKTLFWASEGWMLRVALDSANIFYGIIEEYKELEHIKYELELGKGTMHKPEETKMEPYKPPVTNWSNKYYYDASKDHDFVITKEFGAFYVGQDVDTGALIKIFCGTDKTLKAMLKKSLGSRDIYGGTSVYSYGGYINIDVGSLIIIQEGKEEPEEFEGPKGNVGKKEWIKLTKDGCAICTHVPNYHEHNTLKWAHHELAFYCKDCVDNITN